MTDNVEDEEREPGAGYECELCGAEVEATEWRRCRWCRIEYGMAQHRPGERRYAP